MRKRIKPLTPCRNDLFQHAYDLGIGDACELLRIDESKFWEILYPSAPRIEFPVYSNKFVCCPPELADIISTSYPYLTKTLLTTGPESISQEDSLQDALVITIQARSGDASFDRDEIREMISKTYGIFENFRKLNRRNTHVPNED